MWLDDLIASIHKGDEAAHNSAVTLGLLIERETVRRPIPGDDGGIRQILGETWAHRRLSREDLEAAVDALIRYAREAPTPEPAAVWALGKVHQPQVLDPLVEVLDRVLDDPKKENIAYEALAGITTFQGEKAFLAIRKAAQSGHGEVKEMARHYLEMFHSDVL
jgi:hypothetical protein